MSGWAIRSCCVHWNRLCRASRGARCADLRRVGKRIAIGVEGDIWLVLHLMIAGRLHWRPPQPKLGGRQNLAAFDFAHGSLDADRGRQQAPRLAACGARRRSAAIARSGRHRCVRRRSGSLSRSAHCRESHVEARAYRSAHVQRHRQRLFRRDSACRALVARSR